MHGHNKRDKCPQQKQADGNRDTFIGLIKRPRFYYPVRQNPNAPHTDSRNRFVLGYWTILGSVPI